MAGFGQGQRFPQRVGSDKWGNPSILKGAKINDAGYAKAVYVELGGKTYKIDVSDANKDGVKYWVRVTKVDAQRANKTM